MTAAPLRERSRRGGILAGTVGALLLGAMTAALAGTSPPSVPVAEAGKARSIVREMAVGHFDRVEARFDPALAQALPREELAEQWNALRARAGAFVKITSTRVTAESGGYTVVVMACVFQHAPNDDVLVTFSADGRIAGLYFGPRPTDVVDSWTAPGYAIEKRFHEVAVRVANGPWHLPATLTLPNRGGPFPAVVLVPGSPPMDQDSTMGPDKIFKDLAWGLASRGIAVLRYTKRTHQFGAGLGGGPLSSFTLAEELTDDARAALTLIGTRPEIDHRHTYLLGHSLGGVAVPPLAAEEPSIAGIIVMGTPPGDVLAVLLKRAEEGTRQGDEARDMHAKAIPVFKALRDGRLSSGEVVEIYGLQNPVGYWSWLRSHQAGAVTAQLNIPVLILTAGHDVEALPDAFESWKVALAGHANATVRSYPGLFHLFITSTSTQAGDTPEDWSTPGHVASEVVNDIASWVRH